MSQPMPLRSVIVRIDKDTGLPIVEILSIRVHGCTMTAPLLQGQTVDDAVRTLLARFNFDPNEFRGWKRVPGSKHVIALVVS